MPLLDDTREPVTGEPDPASVRGTCPLCGGAVVSRLEYTLGEGYAITWRCWKSLKQPPACDYRRRL